MKTSKKLYTFLAALIISFLVPLAGCATKAVDKAIAEGAKKLSASEIKGLVAGNTIHVKEYSGSADIEIYPNGTLSGQNNTGDKNKGRWKVDESDRLCIQFKKWAYGEKNCYDVYQIDNQYRQFTHAGILVNSFTVNPGTSRDNSASVAPSEEGKDIISEKVPPHSIQQPGQEERFISSQPRSPIPSSDDDPRARADLHFFYREMAKNCPGCDFKELDLAGANLMQAKLAGTNLENVNFKNTILKMADLKGANLKGADLTEADLGGADLRGADLTNANLQGANFRRANLRGAILNGAQGADLSGAIK